MITKTELLGIAPAGSMINPLTRIPVQWDEDHLSSNIGPPRKLTKSVQGTFSVLSFDGEPHHYASYHFKYPIDDYIGFQIPWADLLAPRLVE